MLKEYDESVSFVKKRDFFLVVENQKGKKEMLLCMSSQSDLNSSVGRKIIM